MTPATEVWVLRGLRTICLLLSASALVACYYLEPPPVYGLWLLVPFGIFVCQLMTCDILSSFGLCPFGFADSWRTACDNHRSALLLMAFTLGNMCEEQNSWRQVYVIIMLRMIFG